MTQKNSSIDFIGRHVTIFTTRNFKFSGYVVEDNDDYIVIDSTFKKNAGERILVNKKEISTLRAEPEDEHYGLED